MTAPKTVRKMSRTTTFEDLKGLRAEVYVRDSTLDQRDGFGPDIQHKNAERFAQMYGLLLGVRWYTEFVSGRSVEKRAQFQQIIEDARLDRFDVLLVDHTSRFGRNQAECIRYKEELKLLGKTVVFVSQGIISGSDRDFLSERINETMDEGYSRNLSRYITEGLVRKAESGLHVGPSPLGFKSELKAGTREHKVPDPATIPILFMALKEYATGDYSYREVANHLNAVGYRTQNGRFFTGYNLRDILSNRFYEGKVVYHQGLPDEEVFNGKHEVPDEVRQLWLRCQVIKHERTNRPVGHPRNETHDYPFSHVLKCNQCGNSYHGEAVYYKDHTKLRLIHERHSQGKQCKIMPKSRSVESLSQEFAERVLAYVKLDEGWKTRTMAVLTSDGGVTHDKANQEQAEKLNKVLENLRKQHLWGDISDVDYRHERGELARQINDLSRDTTPVQMPNMERAAQLLNEMPVLWQHPGVTNKQRESLVHEVFNKISINGEALVAVEPKPEYAPLFADMLTHQPVGYRDLDSPPSPRPIRNRSILLN
jgi:DNA invertase Pin-like site-specific DNA recombinase